MKTFLAITGLLAAQALKAAVDPMTLLADSDRSRGGHLPGLTWTIDIVSHDSDGDIHQVMLASSQDRDTRADYLAPEKAHGEFILMLSRNMWFGRPGLQRPVPISPRQRLIGQASNGDIAATDYRDDYDVHSERTDTYVGEPCAVLDLYAKSKYVTYDRIRYWISLQRHVGVRADFYTLSGKLFKTATFEYRNAADYQGAHYLFASRMIIVDALSSSRSTVFTYSDVHIDHIAASRFELPL